MSDKFYAIGYLQTVFSEHYKTTSKRKARTMDRPEIYKADINIRVTVDGVEKMTVLTSQTSPSADAVKEYAETLLKSGVAVAYRVVYSFDGGVGWYNHHYVSYLPKELESLERVRIPPHA